MGRVVRAENLGRPGILGPQSVGFIDLLDAVDRAFPES
jgi:hypothetical protein